MQPGPSSFVVQPPAGVPAKVLIAELPDVTAGSLVPLAEVVDACVHEIYKRLSELQDILPALHDKARAREVFQFALWARRECVRLLAVVRWCREGDAVSRALNVIDFLQRQNTQFSTVIDELAGVRSGLSGTRLRNPDILTALDVLTTGTYQRLPTRFQTDFDPVKSIDDTDVLRALSQLDEVIRYRLRMVEVVPAEMASYRIADGRVHFHRPGLFKASFSLTGAQDDDVGASPGDAREDQPQGGTWYLLNLEWDFGVGGREGVEDLRRDFPMTPPKPVFEEIAHHCKLQLTPPPPPPPPLDGPPIDAAAAEHAHAGSPANGTPRTGSPYIKMHSPVSIDVKVESGSQHGAGVRATAGEGEQDERVIDAPLVRVYNLLESLGLTFHLEVLHAQAVRMQQLGWAHCFALELSRDRRSFKILYWPRQRNLRGGPATSTAPSVAGTLTITLAPPSTSGSSAAGSGILRRMLNDVETAIKADSATDDDGLDSGEEASSVPQPVRISDRVIGSNLRAEWEIERRWTSGLEIGADFAQEPVHVDPLELDMEGVLLGALRKHANALIKAFHKKVLEHAPVAAVYDLDAGDIELVEEEPDVWAIRVRLHGAQSIAVFVDPRSGRIVLRDKNEILSASGESRLVMSMRMVNDNPSVFNDVLVRLKLSSTTDAAEQRLVYTAPQRTTPASRLRKAAMALHAPLLAKHDQLRATSTAAGLQTHVWTKTVGTYCFVYQVGDRRHGLTFKMLPHATNRRYLVEDASATTAGRPLAPHPPPAASSASGPTDASAVLSLNAAPPQPTAESTPTPPVGRPRFLPIPDLAAVLRAALTTVAGRHPVGRALVAERKRERRPAPVIVLDDQRAVCELALGPEVLAELDRAILRALEPVVVVDGAPPSPALPPGEDGGDAKRI